MTRAAPATRRPARTAAARAAAAAALIAAAPGPAAADPTDTVGFGPRAQAMAGAYVALADDASGAVHNPAGAAFAATGAFLIGYGAGRMDLRIGGRDTGGLDPRALQLAVVAPFSPGPLRAGFALAVHLPDQFLVRFRVRPAEEPRFLLLDNNPHRIVVSPALALRPVPWLSLGGGVTLLGDAAGEGIAFDLNSRGGQAHGEAELDAELPTRAAPIAGAQARLSDRLRLGAAWRGEVDLRIRIDATADADLGEVAQGDTRIAIRAVNYYTPHRVAAGAAFDPAPGWTLCAEAVWFRWSGYRGAAGDIVTLVNLNNRAPMVVARYPDPGLRDVIEPRLGGERRFALGAARAAVRAGWRLSPSPVPDQTGPTSFADNDRHVAGLGAGVTWDDPTGIFPEPVSLDLSAQYHHLVERNARRRDPSGPQPDLRSDGRIVYGAIAATARF